jgi:hypothetical protein
MFRTDDSWSTRVEVKNMHNTRNATQIALSREKEGPSEYGEDSAFMEAIQIAATKRIVVHLIEIRGVGMSFGLMRKIKIPHEK